MSEFDEQSPRDLLGLYRRILAELRNRGVIRTSNAPTGDYAEYLVGKMYGVDLEPNSTKGFDLVTDEGVRIQVKARILATGAGGERQLSVFRSFEFDQAAIVLFSDDFSIHRAALFPRELVEAHSTRTRHVNGYRLMATDAMFELPGVTDITTDLRRVATNS